MNEGPVYQFEMSVRVSDTELDANGHVNNVTFVQWMQDVAIAHSDSVGCTAETERLKATWYVRSHHIEYRLPAFVGDDLTVETGVRDVRTARSTRMYRFVRKSDGQILATASTEWVLVDQSTGRPKAIPDSIALLFDTSE